jgi:para-aminobenzoate synthetase component 1
MHQPAVYETSSRADFYKMVRKESESGDVVLLDSQLPSHPSSGTSYLFAGFDAIFRWKQYSEEHSLIVENGKQGGGSNTSEHASHKNSERTTGDQGDPWKALARFRERFPGYCCGYLGYDLKNAREDLQSANPDAIELPDMWMGRPTRVYILSTDALEQHDHDAFSLTNLHARTSSKIYQQHIQKAKQYITEGDIYEINLSHQLEADFQGDAFDLYIDMHNRGPVPFASYLKIGAIHACCASPERFLTREGSKLISDPIKGTRPRGTTPEEDEEIIRELASSDKEKAENLMIVDLVRNDFSRVCTSGSVKVDNLFEIQHFSTVHQMVSRVEGQLKQDVPTEEILASCFPMGSMTGAPKIRSMQIIEELEDYRRGLYSGAIGVITPDGEFNFNVVIRTAIIRDGKLYYSTGGAITADSDPAAEWEETLVKSRALGGIVRD